MNDVEKKHLALKFYSLSKEDQKSILGQLPSDVRNELVNSISMLTDDDLNEKSQDSKISHAGHSIMQSQATTYNKWNQFITQVEQDFSRKDLNVPLRLLKTIKDISNNE